MLLLAVTQLHQIMQTIKLCPTKKGNERKLSKDKKHCHKNNLNYEIKSWDFFITALAFSFLDNPRNNRNQLCCFKNLETFGTFGTLVDWGLGLFTFSNSGLIGNRVFGNILMNRLALLFSSSAAGVPNL